MKWKQTSFHWESNRITTPATNNLICLQLISSIDEKFASKDNFMIKRNSELTVIYEEPYTSDIEKSLRWLDL